MSTRRTSWEFWTATAVLIGFVVLGAWQNVVFVRSLGSDSESTAVWVGLAVAAAALKVRIPFTAGWRTSRPLVLAFVVAVAFDLFCAYGHGAKSRGSKLEDHAAAVQARKALADDVKRLEGELAAIATMSAPARPSAAIRASLEAQRTANGCVRDETRGACPIVLSQLKADLATAEAQEAKASEAADARKALAGELHGARERLASVKAPVHPDPQAAWIADAFGVTEKFAASWQTLLGMALLELGVIAGAYMAETRAPASDRPATPEPPRPKQRLPPVTPANTRRPGGSEMALETCKLIASGQLVAAGVTVTIQGKEISGSQTALSLACGCSQPTIGRWLQELEAAGSLTASRKGRVTTVSLK